LFLVFFFFFIGGPLGLPWRPAQRRAARCGKKNKTRKRRTSAPARKKKYVRTSFFLVRFWAFLGKGSSKTREQQKNHRGNIFSGGGFFFFRFFFPFDFFVALVKRLSVRGTQKRD
jgi:hypothetical protein